MGHDLGNGRWFRLAKELAETGRYRNIAEVEAALKVREPDTRPPTNKVARGLIDGTCFRARREKGWDT
jgi:hypothetical protein